MTIVVNEAAATRTAEHRFFGAMSLIAAVVIVTGFSNTYGPKVFAGTTVPAIIHVHAAVFASWLVLFVAQTMLVMRGRIRLHQQIGAWGMALAGLMLVGGVMTAGSAAGRGHRGLRGVVDALRLDVKTIDAYLAKLSPDKRAALTKLRNAIKAAAPRAEECISYQMPAFRLDGRMLVWFGAATNHYSLFPGAYPIAACKQDLKKYKTSKGTI